MNFLFPLESVSFPESGILKVQCCLMLVILGGGADLLLCCLLAESIARISSGQAVEMPFTEREVYLAIDDETQSQQSILQR
jgi:hypothetical protein